MRTKNPKGDTSGLTKPRAIRFTEEEWNAAEACGRDEFGGAKPNLVIRTALRGFLRKRKYI